MTVHERPVGATVEWYTPPSLFDALGLTFDLDPAATTSPYGCVPAGEFYHRIHRGERQPWHGRVWLNPPYGPDLPAFVDRMCRHGNGLMLTASRTETRWWQQAAASADALCLLRERLHFIRNDGLQARSSHASTLFAWGEDCVAALQRADLGWTVLQLDVAAMRNRAMSELPPLPPPNPDLMASGEGPLSETDPTLYATLAAARRSYNAARSRSIVTQEQRRRG